MPAEGYEHVRELPRLSPTSYNKLDADLHLVVRLIEQRAYGLGDQMPIPEHAILGGCLPASFEIELTIKGGDLEPLRPIGFDVLSVLRGYQRPSSLLTGRISPSRVFDLVLLPEVLQISAPQRMFYERVEPQM